MTPQNIAELLTCGRTRRFHCFDLLKPQNVAAHVWQVTLLVAYLTDWRPSVNLMLAATLHDLGEQRTGDVPGPVKRAMPGLGEKLDGMERTMLVELGVPNVLSLTALTPDEEAVLNLADYLSGMWHCLEERRLGNRTVDRCFKRYGTYIAEQTVNALSKVSSNAFELMRYMEKEHASL